MSDIYREFGISEEVVLRVKGAERSLGERFAAIDENAQNCQYRIIRAMQEEKVSYECFNGSTGYGYDDNGRDTLERVYARVFNTEDALVRPQIACGTHAISTVLSAILRPGDELLSPVGSPYDTLSSVIGIRQAPGSLKEYGISYAQADLLDDGSFNYGAIQAAINEKTKLVTIQRSKGYEFRPTFSPEKIGELISFIKSIKPDVICFVDNCYGEFVCEKEPTDFGADIMAGSLIKNPGGGLAPLGGYIVGKKELVELCAYRLTSPGLGREVGATVSVMRSFYMGLFNSPMVVAGALKGAILCAKLYQDMGYYCHPNAIEERFDIIQAIRLKNAENLKAFCRGIQAAAAVDSHVTPIPWDMPGYDDQVIMAAGAFISGSSMELSADGPLREPYNVFFQGGLSYAHAKLGVMLSLEEILRER